MSLVVRLNHSVVHIIGSVHSSAFAVELLQTLTPTHLFVEATRETIGLLKRNPAHSSRVLDLPRLIEFSDKMSLPLHAIDTSARDIASRIFSELPGSGKLRLWRYMLGRRCISPLANVAFVRVISRPSSRLDTFVTSWSVSPRILEEARRMRLSDSASEDDISKMIESFQNDSTFISSELYDPRAYREVCKLTGIDQRLQSVLIDYRNEYMSHQVRRIVSTIPENSVCAVVVGRNHVAGIAENLNKGLDHEPSCLNTKNDTKSNFMDQVLLAHLLTS